MPRTKSKKGSSSTRRRNSSKSSKSKSKSKNYSYTLKVPSDTKFLILHESPSEAKMANGYKDKIEKKLGGTVVVMATIGHFYKTSSKELDIDTKKWEPKWQVDRSKRDLKL